MDESTQVIYVAGSLGQADILRNLLADEGIDAIVENETLQFGAGDLPYGTTIAPRVRVRHGDAEAARRIALAFERTWREQRESAEYETRPGGRLQFGLAPLLYIITCVCAYIAIARVTEGTDFDEPAWMLLIWVTVVGGLYLAFHRLGVARSADKASGLPIIDLRDTWDEDWHEDEDAVDEEAGLEWPRCPDCDRRRLTACPVCRTSGTDFPNAFLTDVAGDDDRPVARVVCPICDEVFAPEYLARCEWCGHPFPDGRSLPKPPVWTSPLDEMNVRAWILLAGLVALFGTLVALALSVRAGH